MSNETTPAAAVSTPRRGRPPGSNSFTKIKMEDLLRLVGADGSVPVSKVWLRDLGVVEVGATAPVVITPAVEPEPEQPKIEFSLTTFEDEDGGEKDEE